MIIVKGRELLIPENERYIGTTYDDNSTVRTFRIPRFHEDGMDKSQLDFYVIINYDDGSDPDAVGVTKSVSDDYIVLEWDVGEDITEHSGCLFLWVRGFDHTGAVRWSSFPGVFYIEGSGTEPSDLSDLEKRISEEDKLIRLAKLYKGQPMTAATVAEMKYRDRIYVYVGSEEGYTYGNWYFWDEDLKAWVSGGVYNSAGVETDKTLTLEDFAADAKVVGDEFARAKRGNISVLYPPMALTANAPGSCQVMYDADGHAVLVDMGIYASYDLIKAALKSAGITTIDHVIISHWHGDHNGAQYTSDYANGYDHWKNDFDMSNTVFWIPVMPSTYGTNEDQYLLQSFAGNTINRVTTNGEVFTWNGVTYSIYNASAEDFAYYDEHSPSDYNAYSFIVYATCGNTRICNTADINDVACARAVEHGYALQSSLMTAPHHGVNNSNSGAFANTVRPEYVYVSNHSSSTQNAYRDGIFKSVFAYAKIFTNAENYPGYVSFGINSNGIYVSGSPTVVTPYGGDFIKTIYVDPAATVTDIQDGTADHPYAYIRRAISDAHGITKIVLLGDTSETVVISGANGAIIIDGNGHSCDAVTCINGAVVELNSLNFTVGYWNDSRIVANHCSTQQKIQGVNSFIRLTSISTNADITVLDAKGCVVSVVEVLTPNRTAANSLFIFSYSYASGIFALGQIGGNLNIKSYYSYVNFNRLSDGGGVLPNIWDASAPPLILYDNTVSKYARLTPNGLKYVQNESDALKCKQLQFNLTTAVNVPANTTTVLLNDFDITTKASDVNTLYSFTFDWGNGSAAVATDRLVSNGKQITLKVLAPVALTISTVRLTLWYK